MEREERNAFDNIEQWRNHRIISIEEYTSLHVVILCDSVNKMEKIIYTPSLFNRMVERMEIRERLIKLPLVFDSLALCTIEICGGA